MNECFARTVSPDDEERGQLFWMQQLERGDAKAVTLAYQRNAPPELSGRRVRKALLEGEEPLRDPPARGS